MDLYSIEKMYSEGSDSINIEEQTNSIYFNAGITPKTMSILIEKLLNMEKKILKKKKSLKRKIEEIKKTDKDKDKDKDKNTEYEDYDELYEIKIKSKPINLYITSNGGLVYQVFGAIDTIKGMKVDVHTICKGFVASAGTLLSLAGKKRYITESSYMLIHELRAGHWGKFTHLNESLDNSKQLMDHIKSYYLTKTKITSEELDEQLKKDVSWNAEMCLEKGLVDKIIKY
jgi:ATP-dependent Clp endopeptidase proteolytic subunit ClpP